MRTLLGWLITLGGSWMLISPQSNLGLKALRWMYKFAFSGEVLVGILILVIGYNYLALKPRKEIKASH